MFQFKGIYLLIGGLIWTLYDMAKAERGQNADNQDGGQVRSDCGAGLAGGSASGAGQESDRNRVGKNKVSKFERKDKGNVQQTQSNAVRGGAGNAGSGQSSSGPAGDGQAESVTGEQPNGEGDSNDDGNELENNPANESGNAGHDLGG